MSDLTPPRPRQLVPLALWSSLYLLAVLVGRSAVHEDAQVSVVWPAAGVSVVWLLTARPGAGLRGALLAMGLLTLLGNALTGADLTASLLWSLINPLHGLVGLAVLRRAGWRTAGPLTQVRDVAVLVLAAVASSAVSAVAGGLAAAWRFDIDLPHVVGLLVLRNAVSTLLVGTALLAVLQLLAGRDPYAGPAGRTERVLVAVATVAGTALTFDRLAPALVFLVLPFAVWAAMRTGVVQTSLLVAAQSVLVVDTTLRGHGPFAAAGGVTGRVLEAQTLLAVLCLVGLCLALAERERAEAHELSRAIRERLQDNLDAALVGQATLALSAGGARVVAANPALTELLQRTADELVGTDWLGLVVEDDRDGFVPVLRELADGTAAGWHGELRLRVGGGTAWVQAVLGVVPDDRRGRSAVVTAQFVDISARKSAEARLSHLALHDELTGLPNRALWRDRAEDALAAAVRSGRRVGVLYVDLDRFKTVNDEHGHEVGDLLLVSVAGRLLSAVRPNDTVARIGGDEFVVVCPDLEDERALAVVADRLLACLGPELDVGGRRLTVTASIGTALAPRGATQVHRLLRQADGALYAAKNSGRARVTAFDRLDGEESRPAPLLDELNRALARGELVVHHQPVVDLATGAPVGLEALVRWQHPVRGLLPPSEFLDLLETSDLVWAAGLQVLERACEDAARLQDRFGPLTLHVNVSARQFDRPGLVQAVQRTLARTGLPAHLLTLELTETRLLAVHGRLLQDVDALRAMGVRLAADDVGTGYSTLAHLVEMPIDVLKLDRSFVAGLGRLQSAHAVCSGVIAMARGLGVACVAEGVEHPLQAAVLEQLGYTTGQGCLWGRALPLDELERWLAAAPAVRPVHDVAAPAPLPEQRLGPGRPTRR